MIAHDSNARWDAPSHYDGFFDEAPDQDDDLYASTVAPDDEDPISDSDEDSSVLGG